MRIRQLLSRCFSKIQSISFYRAIARLARSGIIIEEANHIDMQKVNSWLSPHQKAPESFKPHVTNFVAKRVEKVIGFVQLVRHPDDSPCAGYWLFSLLVKISYRRVGIVEELTRAVIKKAKEEGAQELFLFVREDSNNAIRLYQNIGFKMKKIPALEEILMEEKLKRGYRRVVMSKLLCNI